MMNTINDFFTPENYVDNIPEEDFEEIRSAIETIEALSRLAYQSVYVIDYFKRNFMFVSGNPLFLCGLEPQEVKEKGYAFYLDHIPADEIEMLIEINRAGFIFFSQTPVDTRLKLSISYDFHIRHKYGMFLINHKFTPIRLACNGNIWLAVCVVSLASHRDVGNVEAHIDGRDGYWIYSFKEKKWRKHGLTPLSEREKEVLFSAAQGYNSNEIAKNLCISRDTVKFHRKNLFKKLNVNKMTEALLEALNKKLL